MCFLDAHRLIAGLQSRPAAWWMMGMTRRELMMMD
jgi:hypothetical protein